MPKPPWLCLSVRSKRGPVHKAFGERIAARVPDRQTAKVHIRIGLMNRFSALSTAEIVRVG